MTRSQVIPVTLMTTLLLAACAVPYNVRVRVADDGVVALKPGQTAVLENRGSLRYVRVINDSRCAPDVQCISVGDALIAMHWTPEKGQGRDFELHSNEAGGPTHIELDGRRLTLTYLSRQGAEASFKVTLPP